MKKSLLGLFGICGLLGIGCTLKPAIVSVKAEDAICEHVDEDKDGVCDLCEETIEEKDGFSKEEIIAIAKEALGDDFDTENILSVHNIISIVSALLSSGLLIGVVRYFIKDKKIADTVTAQIDSTMQSIVPDTTKKVVVENIEKVITPIFTNLQSQMADISNVLASLTRCMALAQENTPEARTAIVNELSSLKIGDATTLAEVKAYIEKTIKDALNAKEETLKAIEELKEKNAKIIEEEHNEEKEEVKDTYDGTSI